jgi:hypothetical protein
MLLALRVTTLSLLGFHSRGRHSASGFPGEDADVHLLGLRREGGVWEQSTEVKQKYSPLRPQEPLVTTPGLQLEH